MSDKETIIKETNELLEDAQKEVVRALNSQASFLTRLFSGAGAKKDGLKTAQSSISKAINQMKNLKDDEKSIVAKLQKHISERDEKIKALEKQFEETSKESGSLKDQLAQTNAKIKELEKAPKQAIEETKSTTETQEIQDNAASLENSLKEKIKALEEKNIFLNDKLKQDQEEIKNSNDLVIEFSQRLKRLKSEVTSK